MFCYEVFSTRGTLAGSRSPVKIRTHIMAAAVPLNSLVVYRKQPACVKKGRDKLEIQLPQMLPNRGRIYRPDDAFLYSKHPRIRAMVDPLVELGERTKGWI